MRNREIEMIGLFSGRRIYRITLAEVYDFAWSERRILLSILVIWLCVEYLKPYDGSWVGIAAGTFGLLIFVALYTGIIVLLHSLTKNWKVRAIPGCAVSILAAMGGTLIDLAVVSMLCPDQTINVHRFLMGSMSWFLVSEAVTAIFFMFIGPAAKVERSTSTARVDPISMDTASEENDILTIAHLRIQKRSVLSAVASDHSVVIRCSDQELKVQGSISSLEAQLVGYGMLVHRSHWAAFTDFAALRGKGSSYYLELRSGGEIPVSRRNRSQVAKVLADMYAK